MELIKTLDFLRNLGDTLMFVHDMVSIATRGELREEILKQRMVIAKEVVSNPKFYMPDVTKRQLSKNIKYFTEKMKELNRAQIDSYHLPLLNQGLVMICTIFEIFLNHVLLVVMINKPETLIGISSEKNLSVEKIVELKTYDKIMEGLRMKVIEHFSRQGIKEKIKVFKNMGIDDKKIFDFSRLAVEIRERLSGYNLEKLDEIFQKRHDIVHKNILPVQNFGELEEVKEFFEKIILNLSIIVSSKFEIMFDMQAIAKGIPVST